MKYSNWDRMRTLSNLQITFQMRNDNGSGLRILGLDKWWLAVGRLGWQACPTDGGSWCNLASGSAHVQWPTGTFGQGMARGLGHSVGACYRDLLPGSVQVEVASASHVARMSRCKRKQRTRHGSAGITVVSWNWDR